MLPAVERHVVSQWLRRTSGSWLLLPEHAAGRIPDLLVARIDQLAVAARVKGGWDRPLRKRELAALRALRADRSTSTATVALRTFVGTDAARRVLRGLVADGFVKQTDRDAFRRVAPIAPLVSRLVAIEFKRSKWRDALVQARAHASFAHESWVAFDAAFAPRFDRARPYFKTCGIGLVAVDSQTGESRTYARSTRRTPDALNVAVVGESILARIQGRALTQLPQTRLPSASGSSAGPERFSLHGSPGRTFALQLSAAGFRQVGLSPAAARKPASRTTRGNAVRRG